MYYRILCARDYHYGTIAEVQKLLNDTSAAILANAAKFMSPPFTEAEANVVIDTFVSTRSDYENGGKDQEPAWHTAYGNGVAFLDKSADYVDGVAAGNADTITLSRFTPIHVNPRVPATIPGQVKTINHDKDSVKGQIIVESEKMGENVRYGCIMVEGMPLPADFILAKDGTIIFPPCTARIFHSVSNQKKKTFNNLKTGVDYYIYFYVVNAAGAGPISYVLIINCG